MSNKNTWYLPGPFHQYAENVKALAKAAGLRIVDANATDSRHDAAEDVPKVTLRETESPAVLVVTGGGDNTVLLEALERIGQYKIEHESIESLIAAIEVSGELVLPEAGELPIRLHEAFVSIHSRVQALIASHAAELDKLKAERDEWFDTSEALQKQLESLQSKDLTEEDKVAALKAKLDAAGKQYRANASIESLEAAVAELPQA